MDDGEWLTGRFEEQRSHLHAVAYRMLGSLSEADDAVQETWIRLNRAGADGVDNLGGWLTTVVARICLNMLRARSARGHEPHPVHVPDPVIALAGGDGPEDQAVLSDSVGLALLVVLDTLSPAERLAFVLHDMFNVPFEEIGPMVDRTPEAARQLASRARRRVRGAEVPAPERDVARQRTVVDAFLAAARGGDFDGLVALLHPDAVLRVDFGPKRPAASTMIVGAAAVAGQAVIGARPASQVHPALINGSAGVVITLGDRPFAVMAFTVVGDTIVEIDIIGDADRVRSVGATFLAHR